MNKFSLSEGGRSICPNSWILDKRIKNELGMLIIISVLVGIDGFCYESNRYFAELFDIDEYTVSRKIRKLTKLGYLEAFYTNNGSLNGNRQLRIISWN